MEKNYMDWLALVLVIVGGLNWGLVGLGSLIGFGAIDLVQILFGGIPVLANIVYLLVGLAAVYMIYFATKRD